MGKLLNQRGEVVTSSDEARDIAYRNEKQIQNGYTPQSEYEG